MCNRRIINSNTGGTIKTLLDSVGNWGGNLDDSEFIMDLGCDSAIEAIEIKNTYSFTQRSTKEFQVSVSVQKDGDYDLVVHDSLEDSRNITNPPLKIFPIARQIVRFIKFKIISVYGEYSGGLSYFDVRYLDEAIKGRVGYACKNSSYLLKIDEEFSDRESISFTCSLK